MTGWVQHDIVLPSSNESPTAGVMDDVHFVFGGTADWEGEIVIDLHLAGAGRIVAIKADIVYIGLETN